MITFEPITLSRDSEVLESWWKGHKSPPVPQIILPRGWFAVGSGVRIAASFLYVAEKQIAVIEWTTTNPACAYSRDLVEAVKGLYDHLESVARGEGCMAVISFVRPGSWEERTMVKSGYTTSTDDTGHRLYAKPLIGLKNYKQPEGGVLQCR